MIEIRKGIQDDIDAIASFQVMMAKETEELELDPSTVKMGVTAVYEDSSKGEYWIATEEGAIIACLLTLPEWSDWRNGTVLWIHSVYVIPEARGRGIFRQMYNVLVKSVQKNTALRGLRLYVDKSNIAAQKVYNAVGMNGDHYQLFEWMKDF